MEVEDLLRVEYRGQLVVSTSQTSELYECTIQNIRWNFADNKENFVEGVHYFRLKGAELKNFKQYVGELMVRGMESGNANAAKIPPCTKLASGLILWTEKGAIRHCKILNTPKAWEMFDKLEKAYFKTEKPELKIETPFEIEGEIEIPKVEGFEKPPLIELLKLLSDDKIRDRIILKILGETI